MPDPVTAVRQGEYAARGDYHRALDRHWDYLPTYLAKLAYVRRYLDALPAATRVLDAGCGEGILVEEYATRLAIEGVDANYAAPHVRQGSITALPFDDAAFDRVLCLDVLEHLDWGAQRIALGELHRVVAPDGEVLVSAPNLAHLQCRLHFLVRGRLIRTASEHKHPGDRPAAEYLRLFGASGFDVAARHGIFPTLPALTALIRRHPSRLGWLHRLLTRLLPVPGGCFLNLFVLRKRGTPSPARDGARPSTPA
jgi:SAM-dependent methyltransferase